MRVGSSVLVEGMARVWLGLVVLAGGCFDPAEQGTDTEGDTDPSSGSGTPTTGTTTSTTDSSTSGSATSNGPTTETETGLDTGDTSTTSTGGASESTGPGLFECVDGLVDPPIGTELVMVDTASSDDDFSGSCSGLNTPDVAYQWAAPADDFYVIDTIGSGYDTALYVLDGCDGAELACNDNGPAGLTSRIVRGFDEGTPVVLVLDGVAGESGPAVLNIAPVACPTADLGGQALPADFSNQGGPNDHGGACGGDAAPERSFRFTAEEAGLYSFSAASDDFQTAIYLENGPLCGEPELQCNQTAGVESSEVIRNLVAGQSVTLVVDSTDDTGTFTLDVQQLGLTCPEIELPNFGNFSGDINDYEHVMTTSCSPAGDTTFSGVLPAATFSWTAPEPGDGIFGCNVFVDAEFPFALSIQDGACDGPEATCELGESNANGGYDVFTDLGDIDGLPRTITVMPTTFGMWAGPNFSVDIVCAIA